MNQLSSMTGYGQATHNISLQGDIEENGKRLISVSVEFRSVNSRFLDWYYRSPDECRSLEGAIREMVNAKLVRGKIECRINFAKQHIETPTLALNHQLLHQLSILQEQVRTVLPQAGDLRMGEILRWSGVLVEPEITEEQLRAAVLKCAAEALVELIANRQREGGALAAVLLSRVHAMQHLVAELEPQLAEMVTLYQARITQRLSDALSGISEKGTPLISHEEVAERIRQEVVTYGIRIDVAEELNRLATHLEETKQMIIKGGTAGKRLDFMMQELNREANTLGSKSVTKLQTDISMQLKLLIEQMREQIQNLE